MGIRRFRVVLTGLLVILFGAASAVAEDYLQMTLWRELEPMYEPGVEYPVPGDEVARRLLAEARLVVSAMVYGVRFDYVPQDTARGLAGSFSIEPNASIPWGDQALITADAWSSLGRRNITFRYWLGYDQASRRRAWSSNAVPVAAGTGSATATGGHAMRATALDAALEDAVRRYLRSRTPKPRQVSGELLIWQAPSTIVDRGSYLTTVQVKVMIQELVPYQVF